MQTAHLQRWSRTNRPGSALLGLLIVIALAALVYLGQWWVKKTKKDPDLYHNLVPWKEWQLRTASEKPRQAPSDIQPELSEIIKFNVSAEAKDVENRSRGSITLLIYPDGRATGHWGGNYYNDAKVNFDGGGGFEGYICPLKIYRDQAGEDPTKLYFIAKGKFTLHKTDLKKKYRIVGGDLYVTGWLNTDYSANGQITLTSNEKYFEAFYWEANYPVRK